ncbi:N-acetylmuramoyl-L-alanine amidase [Clostridium baratii]|uniref:peptidoglycan recognition protein family protein n=1 Tax=Clostridium baratii TaxID=1561 RepID=UPI0028FEFBC7|nr:N-acetylmuramoyl-L-alanine amidase [Clostridium baratii]MDU1053373.1 N-acetylmuramoyl-L-alanine amidase [Clostridium baratii]
MLKINKKISPYNHYEGRNNIKYIVIHGTDNKNDTAKNNVDYLYRANRGSSAHYFVDDDSIWQSVEDGNGAWSVGDGKGKYGITNMNSINIEMCGTDNGRYSDKTVNNTIELTKYLMKKYNIDVDHVVRHYDASRKNCPSQFSPNNWARWWELKKRLGGKVEEDQVSQNTGSSTLKNKLWEVSISGEEVKALQREINKQGFGNIKVDGYFGEDTLRCCPMLKQGARGNITKLIQQRLLNRGYTSLKANGGADGVFGSGTTIAIKNLQKNKSIGVDGIVGRNTWKALYSK